jgi:acetyl-CoA carboxylase carboxyltransferase component
MGATQLAGVMENIQRDSAKSLGKSLDEAKLQAQIETFRQEVENDSSCYRTSSHLLDDGIIDPRDTRDVLGMCLATVKLSPILGNSASSILARI